MAILSFDVVFFDFSGVLAEEGFVAGLKEIGRNAGYAPETFVQNVADICYNGGYASGKATEADFWQAVRDQFGVVGSDEELRHEILSRFVLRPRMLEVVDAVASAGVRTAILSDHTNWLEELDAEHSIYAHFDVVLNSFREGMTKREPLFFTHACSALAVSPEHTLFIDDNPANIIRAKDRGMEAILYQTYGQVCGELSGFFPHIVLPFA